MSDSRVPMLDEETALAIAAEHDVPDALARLSIFRLLLRRPHLAKGVADTLISLLFRAELDHRLRELVIMRIGWSTGSVYEWTQHWKIAVDFGCTEEELLAVRGWQAHPGFGELERLVLGATDACLAGGSVDPETVAVLREQIGDESTVDLVASISMWSMVSTFLRSFDVPLEDGVEPWPPDGVEPAS